MSLALIIVERRWASGHHIVVTPIVALLDEEEANLRFKTYFSIYPCGWSYSVVLLSNFILNATPIITLLDKLSMTSHPSSSVTSESEALTLSDN